MNSIKNCDTSPLEQSCMRFLVQNEAFLNEIKSYIDQTNEKIKKSGNDISADIRSLLI